MDWFLYDIDLCHERVNALERDDKKIRVIMAVDITEAVVQRCFLKKVFLNISQNSQENTCARFSFLIQLQALGL